MVAEGEDPLCLNGECIDQVDSYICHCETGWFGDQCHRLFVPCSEDRDTPVCLNGGQCRTCDSATSTICDDNYRCICPTDIEGYNCEITPPAVGRYQSLYIILAAKVF